MNPQTNSEKWFRFAMMYAKAASHLMDSKGTPYESVCYLICLSAECAMKGFLFERDHGLPPPETHNLVELCHFCGKFDSRFSSLEDGLQRMGKWASPSGFPSFEKASQEEVYQALDTIQGILRVLQDQEQSQGPSLTM